MENEVEPIKLKNPQLIGKNHNKLSEIRSVRNKKLLQRRVKDNRLDNRLDNRFDNLFANLNYLNTYLNTPKYYLNTTEANRMQTECKQNANRTQTDKQTNRDILSRFEQRKNSLKFL